MFPELLLRKAFPRRGRKKPWQASASKSPIVGRGVGASRVTSNIKLPRWVARLNGHQGEISELVAFAAGFSTRAVKRESVLAMSQSYTPCLIRSFLLDGVASTQ